MFKYYISAFGGGGLNQNADTADALEGGGGRSKPKWWHDDTLKGRGGGDES